MKILLFFCIALVSGAEYYGYKGAEYDAFEVTYNKYYSMPWTVSEATKDNKWIPIDKDWDNNMNVYCQPGNPQVLLYFDNNGNIGGIGICFVKDEMNKKALANNLTFDYYWYFDKSCNFKKSNYFGKKMWCTHILFVHPKTLAEGGRPGSLDKTKDDVIQGIYFKDDKCNWVEASKDECHLNEGMTHANCYVGMGNHCPYKLQELCENSHPVFLLYNEGRLNGMVFNAFGTHRNDYPNTQSYLEDVPVAGAKLVAPMAPQCLFDTIENYGMTMMHVYFKKNASAITCPAEDWKIKNCKK